MADLYLGRFNRFVEKLFSGKGGPTVLDVEPNIQTVLPIDSGVEDRYLQGWQRFSGAASVAANAANNCGARLRNPAGSGCIVVIERFIVSNAVSTNSFFNISQGGATTDLSTTSTGFRTDSRSNPNSVAIISSQNTTPPNLASGASMLSRGANILGAELVLHPDQEFVLLPGDAIQAVDNTQNEQLVVNFGWRERAIETSESS